MNHYNIKNHNMKNSIYNALRAIVENTNIAKDIKLKFIKDNINEVSIKELQIKDKKDNTILNYLCRYKFSDILIYLFNNFSLKIYHFQNIDSYNRTELYWLCRNKMDDIIMILMSTAREGYQLNARYFQNMDAYDRTELYYLCKNKMHNIIMKIYGLKAEHFQNSDQNGESELWWLCCNEMSNTISQLNLIFRNKCKFKAEHFLNKNSDNVNELNVLCTNEMKETIYLVDDWKVEHFRAKEEKLYANKIELFKKNAMKFDSFNELMIYACKHNKLNNKIEVIFK